MSKRDITRDIHELKTVTPSAKLDRRIQHARDAAIHTQTPSHPIRFGWAAIFGIGMGVAGFGIGFVVALNLGKEPVPTESVEVPVQWVSQPVDLKSFDLTQQPDPPFGRYFERMNNMEQGVQQ